MSPTQTAENTAEKTAEKTAKKNQPKPLILIVDDIPQNLQVLAGILRKKSYKIAIASDGEQALEMLNSVCPALILLDVMMPGIDGFEVCRRLKESDTHRDIPVIFLTARTNTDDIVKGFDLGAVDYITKPFNGIELLARVRTHLALKFAREELERKNRELLEAQEQLELAARTDPLTQLSNRRDIVEKIEAEKIRFERSQNSFTLVICDIDNFKLFNDQYGHDCGDYVLTTIAKLMKFSLRKQDTVARWGGEEFLILLPETNTEGGRILAEKISELIADQTLEYKGIPLSITLTFGIDTYNYQDLRSIDDCIRMADHAMYEGKKNGKNCVVVAREQD